MKFSDIIKRITMAILSVFNLVFFTRQFTYLPLWIFICVLFLIATLSVLISVLQNTSGPIYKLLFVITIAVSAVVVITFLFVNSGILDEISSVEELREFMLSSGSWAIVVLFFLSLFSVVVLPIPAAVTIVLGTIMFGSTISFIVNTLATIIGSFICFVLGRVFGKKVVYWIIGKETTDKYAELINEKGKAIFFTMMLFPFFPDDTLCIVAGLTTMSLKFFSLSVCLARPVMLAFYSYFGTGELIPFSGWGIPVWVVLFLICAILVHFINKRINKRTEKSNMLALNDSQIKSENNDNDAKN